MLFVFKPMFQRHFGWCISILCLYRWLPELNGNKNERSTREIKNSAFDELFASYKLDNYYKSNYLVHTTDQLINLTINAKYHTNRGVSYGIPGNAFISTFISSSNITYGKISLRTNMKFSTLSYLNSILQQSTVFCYAGIFTPCFQTWFFFFFFLKALGYQKITKTRLGWSFNSLKQLSITVSFVTLMLLLLCQWKGEY